MSAEQVALIPGCAECGDVWLPDDEERWRAYLDTDSELVFYCPKCAEQEFRQMRVSAVPTMLLLGAILCALVVTGCGASSSQHAAGIDETPDAFMTMAPMSATVERRHLLTISEVAARLRLSERIVHRLIERDELPSLQLGGPGSAVRIDESEFDDAWLYGERDRLAGRRGRLLRALAPPPACRRSRRMISDIAASA